MMEKRLVPPEKPKIGTATLTHIPEGLTRAEQEAYIQNWEREYLANLQEDYDLIYFVVPMIRATDRPRPDD